MANYIASTTTVNIRQSLTLVGWWIPYPMLRIFKDLDLIKKSYSGDLARGYVADLVRYHRIQASPGIRAAAHYCAQRLREFGLRTRIFTYPADGKKRFWSLVVPKEWAIEMAHLEMIEPKRMKLGDFHEEPLSVIQRSGPFEGVVELVVLNDGEEIDEYRDLDLKGKVVLTKGDINRVYQLAVVKSGAVGILYDGMRKIDPIRDRFDLPDGREYRSFWWQKGDPICFGFVLTPRQGDKLRALARKKRVKLRVVVKSRFYSGKIEVVSGLIPGRSRKEIVVLSHLCHPRPSANDNASGCGASLEIARTLSRLIRERKLRRPKRSIRFLYLPEMTGTYAYLASDEERIKRIMAGINLDMVGEDQAICGSSLLIEEPPAANPSFTADLLLRLLEEFCSDTKGFGGSGGYPLFRHATVPFSGGSDHYILSDPTVGIPCPMIIQWPDRFYHTSLDTIDKVDPGMLFRIGSLAAGYVYFLAQAGREETQWLSYEMAVRTRIGLLKIINDWRTRFLSGEHSELRALERKVSFYLTRREAAITSLRRFGPVPRRVGRIKDIARQLIAELKKELRLKRKRGYRLRDEWDRKAHRMIPERIYKGPLSIRSHFHRLSEDDKERYHRITKPDLVWNLGVKAIFWCDGKRTLREISDLVEQETGQRNTKFLVEYFELLAKMKLIRIRSPAH